MNKLIVDIQLPSADDTELLGAVLARALPPLGVRGAVLYLHGELGAGKTTCVRGLLRQLGIGGPVRSPSYALVETYAAERLTCVHVDLYRLSMEAEAESLGLRDLAGAGCLLMVEWPLNGAGAVPAPDLEMRLEYRANGRTAHLTSVSGGGAEWLEHLVQDTRLSPYVTNIT